MQLGILLVDSHTMAEAAPLPTPPSSQPTTGALICVYVNAVCAPCRVALAPSFFVSLQAVNMGRPRPRCLFPHLHLCVCMLRTGDAAPAVSEAAVRECVREEDLKKARDWCVSVCGWLRPLPFSFSCPLSSPRWTCKEPACGAYVYSEVRVEWFHRLRPRPIIFVCLCAYVVHCLCISM